MAFVVPPIHLFSSDNRILDFLLMAFRWRSLDPPVTAFILFSLTFLSLGSSLGIEFLRKAVRTQVYVRYLFTIQLVVALDVLPCIAFLAQDGVAIIICVRTYAFDCVVFIVLWVGVGKRAIRERRGM